VLHRVQRAEVLEVSAVVPEGFDLDRYIQEGEFSYPVGEPIRLEAVFSHGAAFHLHDTPLSADQVLTALDDERVLVRATVDNTAELRWWLLGFGELVEVLAPADLRDEFRTRATVMAVLYQPPHRRRAHGMAKPIQFTLTLSTWLAFSPGGRRPRPTPGDPSQGTLQSIGFGSDSCRG
jgi:hypothetical protein